MAEYRAIRLISKHFGVGIDYINERMEFGEFWCSLAEAMDADELEDYRAALLQGGKEAKKKWKWATPDHAGTRPVSTGARKEVRTALMDFANALTRGQATKTRAPGGIKDIANIIGAKKVFRDEEGNLFDEEGNPVDAGNRVFIPMEGQDRVN